MTSLADGRRYRCPKCHESGTLYEVVTLSGWRGLDDHLNQDGEHDTDGWHTAESTGMIGCSECEWTGGKRGLEALGNNGEPLPPVIPGQIEIEA